MTTDPVATATARLLEARRRSEAVPLSFMDAHPLSIAEGIAVQARIQEAIGAIGAWKASPTSTVEKPRFGPVFAKDVYGVSARFAADTYREPGIECEVAFRLGRDLTDPPYSREEVADAIDSLVPLIEIAETRLDDASRMPDPVGGGSRPRPPGFRQASDGWWMADALGNGAVLVGPGIKDWRSIDTRRQPATLTFNGKTVAEAVGNANPDLVAVLQRMVNQVGRHCGGVLAGHVVTFGSMTGNLAADPGTEAIGRFPGLGELRVMLEQ
jgi:2-keto-4-pentenoate hydratase